LTSLSIVPSVSSYVIGSSFFFAGHFHFFFGGCTDLKDCTREFVANGCWGELWEMSSSWSLELASPKLSYGSCVEGEQAGSDDDSPRDDCRGSWAGTDDDGPDSRLSLGDPSFSGIMTM
jgi:hypothetical protein